MVDETNQESVTASILAGGNRQTQGKKQQPRNELNIPNEKGQQRKPLLPFFRTDEREKFD